VGNTDFVNSSSIGFCHGRLFLARSKRNDWSYVRKACVPLISYAMDMYFNMKGASERNVSI